MATPKSKGGANRTSAINWRVYLGTYRRIPYENTWHLGTIRWMRNDANGAPILRWQNQAGVEWTLHPSSESWNVKTGPENPYQSGPQGIHFRFRPAATVNTQPAGFQFNQDFFQRVTAGR